MKSFFLLFLFCAPFLSFSQTIDSGDLQDYIEDIISDLPDADADNNPMDDEYALPTMGELTTWENILADLLASNFASADMNAAMIDYDVVVFTDLGSMEVYYILEKTAMGTNYWGTYVFKLDALRNDLILMSPHPRKDFNTGKQGIYCFIQTDAFAFMLAGTNRCNAATPMAQICSGQTSVCSHVDPPISENYPISDLAHDTSSVWQKTTAYLHDEIEGTYFVQLHGFTKKMTDPYLIMSNGTRVTPATDKISTLATALFNIDNLLDSKIGHIDLAWDRLLGFSNTNGRYINNSVDPCSTNATTSDGRFIHIEQEKDELRATQAGWDKMAMALSTTFSGILPLSPVRLYGEINETKIKLHWSSESENEQSFVLEKSTDGLSFNFIGDRFIKEGANFIFQEEASSVQHYYRLKMTDASGNFIYSNVVSLFYNTAPLLWFDSATKQLKFQTTSNHLWHLKLYNKLGQQVLIRNLTGTTHFQISLAADIYYYSLEDNKDRFSGTLFLH